MHKIQESVQDEDSADCIDTAMHLAQVEGIRCVADLKSLTIC